MKRNIAFLLCEAIDSDEFDLCRKKTNLFKRNGIIWKEDKRGRPVEVGIKPTALVQFIRNQNGYQNYSSRKITDYLRDTGALTLQEKKSNTCHLGKDKKAAFCRESCGLMCRLCVTTPRNMNFSQNRRASNPNLSIAPAASSRSTGAVPQVSDTAKSDYPPPVVYIV